MAQRYPAVEPYDSGMLGVGDGHSLYWETCGNPEGTPALVLHGGPGSGCSPGMRRWFDPDRYRALRPSCRVPRRACESWGARGSFC